MLRRVALAGFVVLAAAAAAEEPASKPLPVDKTRMLDKEGSVFHVEGRVRIPQGVELTIQKDVRVVAKGEGDAVLEVAGSLMAHGTLEKPVLFENVWIEPAAKYEEVRVDMTHFLGNGGMRTRKEGVDGRFFVENVEFKRPATLSGTFVGNECDVQDVIADEPVVLRAAPPEGSPITRAQLMVHLGSFRGGLEVEGFAEATIRSAILGGRRNSFRDCRKLTIDANEIAGGELEIRQSVAGRFKDARLQKCDVGAAKVVLFAPIEKNLRESLYCDKCWFKGVTDEKELRAKVIFDAEDDPACGVTIAFKKIADRKLGLAPGASSNQR